jgi:hypothetical protein
VPRPGGEDIGAVDLRQQAPAHRVEADVEVKHSSHGLGGGRWAGVSWGSRSVREKQGRQGEGGKVSGFRARRVLRDILLPKRGRRPPAISSHVPIAQRRRPRQWCTLRATHGSTREIMSASAQAPQASVPRPREPPRKDLRAAPLRSDNAGLDGPDAHQTRAAGPSLLIGCGYPWPTGAPPARHVAGARSLPAHKAHPTHSPPQTKTESTLTARNSLCQRTPRATPSPRAPRAPRRWRSRSRRARGQCRRLGAGASGTRG